MSQSSRQSGVLPTILLFTGVAICAAATFIEFNRAMDGHGRAWMYTVQWPLIGAFLIWIWHRYRTDGNVLGGVTEHYRQRVEQAGADSDDPELRAWRDYVKGLDRDDP